MRSRSRIRPPRSLRTARSRSRQADARNGLAPAPTTLVSRLFPSMRFAFAPADDWNSDFRVSSGLNGSSRCRWTRCHSRSRSRRTFLAPPDPTKQGIDKGHRAVGRRERLRHLARLPLWDRGRRRHPPRGRTCRSRSGRADLRACRLDAVRRPAPIASPAAAACRDRLAGAPLGAGRIPIRWRGTGLRRHRARLRRVAGKLRCGPAERLRIGRRRTDRASRDLVLPSVLLPPYRSTATSDCAAASIPVSRSPTSSPSQMRRVVVPLGDSVRIFLSQLFFATPPEGEDWWSGLTLEGGVAETDGAGTSTRGRVRTHRRRCGARVVRDALRPILGDVTAISGSTCGRSSSTSSAFAPVCRSVNWARTRRIPAPRSRRWSTSSSARSRATASSGGSRGQHQDRRRQTVRGRARRCRLGPRQAVRATW